MRPALWTAALLACGAAYAQTQQSPWSAGATGKPILATKQNTSFGVVLLAHGGSSEWNAAVEEIKSRLSPKYPIEIALGMADPIEIQRALDHLAQKKVKKAVVVPLFVSSHSEVMDQLQFVLGLRKEPSSDFVNAPHAHMSRAVLKRVHTKLPLVLTPALDGHPVVADILLDRAKKMSREPAKEAVVIIGHGPLKDEDNARWIANMDAVAAAVKTKGGFFSVQTGTLRDDAPPAVRANADKVLRETARALSRERRVIVVPLLIASGGVERHIKKTLDGIFYEWTGQTLLPDPRLAGWVDEMAAKHAAEAHVPKFSSAQTLTVPAHKKLGAPGGRPQPFARPAAPGAKTDKPMPRPADWSAPAPRTAEPKPRADAEPSPAPEPNLPKVSDGAVPAIAPAAPPPEEEPAPKPGTP
ncbi:MAG: hypothetical protein HY059_09070 [Proteobacteria bacterium]|nr:hypothetical protein [Pseudomonadota bacterium]